MNAYRVFGGIHALVGEFPFMARIGTLKGGRVDAPEKKKKWKCGACIITKRFLLSAAHCGYPAATMYWAILLRVVSKPRTGVS